MSAQRRNLRPVGLALGVAILTMASSAAATPPLYTPWPCDVTYSITQGHNTGSHTAEGAWAWDVGIPVGGEVSAPADGVVRLVRMDSTVGGCSSTYANDANYVVVDFGDGTEALFLHLETNSSSLTVGQPVKQGDVVGRVGLTGWVCGAHLHFQIQQTCASWWCQSIQSSFVGVGDPVFGTDVQSNNCPSLEPCEALAGGVTVIDELTTCYSRETSFWWSTPEGYADHHYYTHATDAAETESTGHWTFDVEVGGTYALDVFIPDTDADTAAASYQLDTGAETIDLGVVDQSAEKGWVTLGEHELVEGTGRSVSLFDNTGEPVSSMIPIAHDAIRFSWVDPAAGGSGGGGGGGGALGEGGSTADGGGGAGSDPSTGGDAASGGDDDDSGCACRTGAPSHHAHWPLALLLLLPALGSYRRRASHERG